MKQFIEKYN